MEADSRDLHWYMAGRGFYFLALGIQNVLFPWLLAIGLHESPARIGLAQTLSNLPMLTLVLLGGAVADRSDCRGLLLRLQLLVTLPPLALALAAAAGFLDYAAVVLFGLALGVLGAFIVPARDSLLTRVSAAAIQRGVTLMLMVQFGGQLMGFLLAGAAGRVGAVPLLAAQSAAMLLAAFTTSRIEAAPPEPREQRTHHLADIGESLAAALRTPRIAAVLVYIVAEGVFFIGLYLVVLPLLVRDHYHAGSAMLAGLNIAFSLGVMLISLLLMRWGEIRRQGRALMAASFVDVLVTLSLWLQPAAWLAYACLFAWGLGAGLSMSMSRSLVQEAAPAAQRARILAAYQLAFIGGAPLGSLFVGTLAEQVGLYQAMLWPVAAMAAIWLAMFALTPLWRLEAARAGG
jgi:MFS family permease